MGKKILSEKYATNSSSVRQSFVFLPVTADTVSSIIEHLEILYRLLKMASAALQKIFAYRYSSSRWLKFSMDAYSDRIILQKSKPINHFFSTRAAEVWRTLKLVDRCNGCSPIKVKENFTPPSSFQRFQICPDIVFLQLIFVNCIIRYTVECPCITCCSISLSNLLLSFAV